MSVFLTIFDILLWLIGFGRYKLLSSLFIEYLRWGDFEIDFYFEADLLGLISFNYEQLEYSDLVWLNENIPLSWLDD